jgi:uncharacterized membrane protein YqgA involved in biofilm formation
VIVGAGTLLNTATVLTGGVVGTVAGHRIPVRMRELVVQVLGVFVVAYGVKVAITPSFTAAPDLAIVLIGLLIGSVAGSLLNVDGALLRFGAWAERRLVRDRGDATAPDQATGRVARAFVTTSLLYCVGPLTILGSFDDGARGDILLLGIKSTLDGIASLAFAVTLGRGVLLSAVSVLVVQGALTGVAYATRGTIDQYLVTQALGAGGLMLVAIGLGLLEIRRIRVADMLPALVVVPVLAAISRALGWGL